MNGTRGLTRPPVAARARQIANVLARHGLGTLLDQSGLRRFAPLARVARGHPHGQPERLRLALGELGVVFTKLGQMLSTRADVVPPEFAAELSKLQDAAPAVPVESVLRTIEEDLGAPADRLFARFGLEPLASASIGQVHAATLHDGSEVVVKVRRPGVEGEVERDLELLRRVLGWVQANTALAHDVDLSPVFEELAYTLRNELDYVRESYNAERLRRAFVDDATVWIPRTVPALTTRRVLTLERVTGIKVTDLETIDRMGISRRAIAENAVRMFLREVLELGFFHADPHPGNFFVQPDAAIAVVDFGMVGRVSESVRGHLLRGGLAAAQNDADALAEELFALGVAGRRADRAAFVRDLDHLLGRYEGRSIRDLSARAVTEELSAIAFRHRLQLPSDLALLLRVVAMSEGLGLMLDPEFHYLEFAAPYFKESRRPGGRLRLGVARLGRAALEAVELGADMPRRTKRLLGRLERGEMELNVRHEGAERFLAQLQRMTNRLAMAMILSASVVALGVAIGVRGALGLEGHVRTLFLLGFVFSLAFGAWLIVSIWKSGRR